MAIIAKIRRMYFRDQLSIKEIVRRTSLSRNTVRKWLKAEGGREPVYRRVSPPTKLTPFAGQLEQWLKSDALRPKRDRRTGWALYQELRAAGYEGSYSRVTDYLRAWHSRGTKPMSGAFVPLVFGLGEAFQFDWSEEELVIGGVRRRLQVSHLKLCASRAFWLVAYFSQGHEMLFDAHTRSFEALGGICRRGIYDNMKTAVDRVCRGKQREVNTRFAAMCSYYLFEADFCTVASGWEKGVVEKNVQDSRRRIWQEAGAREWATLDEVNDWVGARCRTLWGELRHPEHAQFSVEQMLDQEREYLMPLPGRFDGYVDLAVRVTSTCLINVKSNRYSVLCEWAGQRLDVRLYAWHLEAIAGDVVVVRHDRLNGRDQVHYDWQHYITLLERKPGALRNGAPFADMPALLQRLRAILLRREGGDREMAEVLAAVPQSGLEHVLVAVELVLESRAVSGAHVLNVLSRLCAPVVQEPVVTVLTLKEAPRADTQRYDQLRATTEAAAEVDHA